LIKKLAKGAPMTVYCWTTYSSTTLLRGTLTGGGVEHDHMVRLDIVIF